MKKILLIWQLHYCLIMTVLLVSSTQAMAVSPLIQDPEIYGVKVSRVMSCTKSQFQTALKADALMKGYQINLWENYGNTAIVNTETIAITLGGKAYKSFTCING